MPTVEGRQGLRPDESFDLIRRTVGKARRELIMPDGPIAKAWGLAVLVGFGCTAGVWALDLADGGTEAALIGLAWAAAVGAAFWYSTRKGKEYYSPGAGIWSPVMQRVLWAWALGIVLGAATGFGLGVPAYQIAALIAYFVAVMYVISGVLCFDLLQTGTGVWIGVVNAVALPLDPIPYALAMGVLVGGGLIVSGILDDRRWARVTTTDA